MFVTWAITGHFEDIKELENDREIKIEALKNGYIECVENNFATTARAKIVWKKECESTAEILKNTMNLEHIR